MMGKRLLQCVVLSLLLSTAAYAQGIASWKDTYGKSPTEFSVAEWREIIDARWGQGPITESKLAFFDEWYGLVDSLYGAFQKLNFDPAAFRDQYRPEIEQGVSRGRFAAIMSYFASRLEDLHTYLWDTGVRNTTRAKGVPLLFVGQFSNNPGFGATLTPLPDSTLLVYRVLSSHPLDLEPGDVVLGYDGKLWKDIYPKLLEAELPLYLNPVHAATAEGNAYYHLSAAGLNWHLFDTIDILKYRSGDTLHLDTNLLANERRTIYAHEGLDIPGVVWPERQVDRVSFGVVEGTNVGYIYVTSWSFDAQFDILNQFRQAIVNLWFTELVDALVLDCRCKTGGGSLGRGGWTLLFNRTTPTIGFDERADPHDHFAMREDPGRRASNLVIRPDEDTYWDKPIAVLMGPGSISAGELESLRASFHPRARLFGLPAPGGNTGSIFPTFSRPEWFGSLATSNMYLVDGHEYLAHVGLQPDERVWLDRDDVAEGKDTVVETALAWISSELNPVAIDQDELPLDQGFKILGAYPNPFTSRVTIEMALDAPTDAEIVVLDLLGRRVASLFDGPLAAGRHRVEWDGGTAAHGSAPSGIYFVRVSSQSSVVTKPIVRID